MEDHYQAYVWNMIFERLSPVDCLSASQVSVNFHASLKSIIEANFTFKIPYGKQMHTLAPKRVIVKDPISIPVGSKELTLIIFNSQHGNALLSALPRTGVTRITFDHCDTLQDLPPTLTHLITRAEQSFRHLPTSITHLTLGATFNGPLDDLPETLTHLNTGDSFNLPINNLPHSLTHLNTGKEFNQSVSQLPPKLVHFCAGMVFNQEVDKLPVTLTKLSMFRGICFYNSLDNLPASLTHLSTGFYFDKPVDNLPPNLTHLTFGSEFTQAVDNLPASLTHLFMGQYFTKTLDNLPPKLTFLTVSEFFNHPLDNLPAGLITLLLGSCFNHPIDNLPPALIHLFFSQSASFNHPVDKLPNNLKHLRLGRSFNHPINHLPAHLTHLTLGEQFNHPLDQLPPTVTHISLSKNFNRLVDNLLPTVTINRFRPGQHVSNYCEDLWRPGDDIFNWNFNMDVHRLPSTLTHFSTGDYLDQPLAHLPPTITHLTTGHYFHQTLDDLPTTITHLTSADTYFEPLASFPPKLSHLTMPYRDVKDLPTTLTHLNVTQSWDTTDNLKGFPPLLTHLSLEKCASLEHAPPLLTYLSTGDVFNGSVSDIRSPLTHLITGSMFDQPVTDLPTTLTHLTVGFNFDQPVDHLPPNLTHLVTGFLFNQPVDQLPNTLTHLTLGNSFNRSVDRLPCSLVDLAVLGSAFDQPVDQLPPTLSRLQLGDLFDHSVDCLPPALTQLDVGDSFNNHIDNLPSNLAHLTVGNSFNKPVDNLPAFLQSFIAGHNFNQVVDRLPSNLIVLTTGDSFNQPISNLPQTLTHFTTGHAFNQRILRLPTTLRYFTAGTSFTDSTNLPSVIKFTARTKPWSQSTKELDEANHSSDVEEYIADPEDAQDQDEPYEIIRGDSSSPLISVYDNYDSFYIEVPTIEDEQMGKFCFAPPIVHSSGERMRSVVEEHTFKTRFSSFTHGILEGWSDWEHMVVVGDSVLFALLSEPPNNCLLNIDVYIYGIVAEEMAKKIERLYQQVLNKNSKVSVVQMPEGISICLNNPNCNLRIIGGEWQSISQILFQQDIDCASVAYDGSQVWASEPAHFSINHCCVTVSPDRYSPDYDRKLLQYGLLGFEIRDPYLNPDFSNISVRLLSAAKVRILQHGVEGSGIYGLKLLLVGYFWPRALEARKVKFFTDPFALNEAGESVVVKDLEWLSIAKSLYTIRKTRTTLRFHDNIDILDDQAETDNAMKQIISGKYKCVSCSSVCVPNEIWTIFPTNQDIFCSCCKPAAECHAKTSLVAFPAPIISASNLLDIPYTGSETYINATQFTKSANVESQESSELIFNAISHGYVVAVRELLQSNPNIVNTVLKKGRTPLHYAAKRGHDALVKLLLRERADITKYDTFGATALHYACAKGRNAIVTCLLAHGADPNSVEGGVVPLSLARNESIAHSLLQAGALVDGVKGREIAAGTLAYKTKKAFYELIFAKDTTLRNETEEDYITPLHYACAHGRGSGLVSVLLAHGADANARCGYAMTPLLIATQTRRESAARELLKSGSTTEARNVWGETALIAACRLQLPYSFVDMLVKNNADLDAQRLDGYCPITIAFKYGAKTIPPSITSGTAGGQPILEAAKSGVISNHVRKLIPLWAKVPFKSKKGMQPLQIAARHGSTELIALLAEHGVAYVEEEDLLSPIYLAAKHGHAEAIQLLLDHTLGFVEPPFRMHYSNGWDDPDLWLPEDDEHGYFTPLYLASQKGHVKACVKLIERGARISPLVARVAAQEGHKEVLEVLLKDNDELKREGLLQWAVMNGHIEAAKFLLQIGMDVNESYEDGLTPLHLAAMTGPPEMVELLISHGAKLDTVTEDNKSVLTFAQESTESLFADRVILLLQEKYGCIPISTEYDQDEQ